ncbi:MAG: phosphoribosylglycinamide formyltransferase [Crocinitomicaceae bacterium]|nr:phosphoribosylglycinamide formyltransferase [Crocinitomicaceae bacterium]
MNKIRIAIFASGTGSNAVNLIRFFENDPAVEVAFVLSNKEDAKVLKSSKDMGVTALHFSNQQVADGTFLVDLCTKNSIDWIVLAGYLRLIPSELIQTFKQKMVNLHPSLLPMYGGEGMHGRNVHSAVLKNKENKSGITIHFVNEEFDKGEVIAQFHCALSPQDTIDDLERKIKYLEQTYFPTVVRGVILS